MSIGILPKVNSSKQNRGAKQERSDKVEEQPSKKLKSFQNGKSDDKGAVAVAKYLHWVVSRKTLSRQNIQKRMMYRSKPEAESVGINSTGTIHTVHAT